MNNDTIHPKFAASTGRSIAKAALRRYVPIWYRSRAERVRRMGNPFADDLREYHASSKYRLGIIEEPSHYHQHYIAACRAMKVSYLLIDLLANDWLQKIKECDCAGFLVWPAASSVSLKQLYDERLKIIQDELRLVIFPSYDELWMWESKRRMHDWLVANDYPTPKTWIFYKYEEALAFLRKAEMPIVFKTDHGDCSKGVEICRDRKRAMRIAKRAFSSGLSLGTIAAAERQWGNVLYQAFLGNAIEWRVIKIADSYFGYKKKKLGDFASGSHTAVYADVPKVLLDLIRRLSDEHNFQSLSIDVMLENERPYIIEVQSIFGDTGDPRKLRVDGKAGRYVYDVKQNQYVFEEGVFDENICCNLRVACLLGLLEGMAGREHPHNRARRLENPINPRLAG